jgi:CubicO group peptidase (beta-lactamase class C family)
MYKTIKIVFIFLLLCIARHSMAQIHNSLSDSATHKIDSVMNGLMKKKHIIGSSIAIVDHGQIVYAKGYGFSDRRKKIHSAENKIFSIGSITKTFTALAVMKLHDEGKIDLDKSASFYLPELKIKSLVEKGDILKIKNLLSHTSGLTDGVMNNDLCKNEHDFNLLINDLNQEVLVHKTNWKFSYSNIGYDLLGSVIERVSGMKYEEYVRKNFLEKMDMTQSGFYNHPEDSMFSKGYQDDTVETAEPLIGDFPAGRLFCSAMDMCHFMQMLQNNGMYNNKQVISKEALMQMETSHLGNVKLFEKSDYGYGLFVEKMYMAEDSIIGDGIGHAGDTYNFHSTCFVFPKIKWGIVVLANSENGHSFCNTSLIKIFSTYQEIVKGMKLHPAPSGTFTYTGIELSTKELAGKYPLGENDPIEIKRINDHKLMMIQDKQHIVLRKQKDATWSLTAKILLIIPIPLKGAYLEFEKIDSTIFLKEVSKRYGMSSYASMKETPDSLTDSWKKVAGKYLVLNSCEGNKQGVPEEIIVKGNKIFLKVRFDAKTTVNFSFREINGSLAAIDGLDRRSGMVMKLLPNGNVYFSGYEMVKK